MAVNDGVKIEGKLNCAFKNDMGNLANLHQSMFESLNLGLLLAGLYPEAFWGHQFLKWNFFLLGLEN